MVTIKVIGDFDFSFHSEFRNCYRYNTDPGMTYFVDLSDAEYMDSSALGMLMLLKEHAENTGGSVILSRPSPKIRKLLITVKFEKLFNIQD
jgi:anti-anti-sigma factor